MQEKSRLYRDDRPTLFLFCISGSVQSKGIYFYGVVCSFVRPVFYTYKKINPCLPEVVVVVVVVAGVYDRQQRRRRLESLLAVCVCVCARAIIERYKNNYTVTTEFFYIHRIIVQNYCYVLATTAVPTDRTKRNKKKIKIET